MCPSPSQHKKLRGQFTGISGGQFTGFYNWYPVEDARGLCPVGWHIPSDGEWTELTNYLGGASVAGSQMKSAASDTPPWNGSNSSGFSGLPGGRRASDANFYDVGDAGAFWSSSTNGSYVWVGVLNSDNSTVNRYSNGLQN